MSACPCRILALVLAAPLAARPQVPEVRVAARAEHGPVRAGSTFRIAVVLTVPDGWHIGWINPGAGGLATTISWQAPAAVRVGETEWPYPEADETGGVTSNVYRGTVVLVTPVTVDSSATGDLSFKADLDFGLCRVQCVRQTKSVRVGVGITREAPGPAPWWDRLVPALRALPVRAPGDAVRAEPAGDGVRLVITGVPNLPAPGTWVTFFPLEAGKTSVVAMTREVAGGIAVTLPGSVLTSGSPARLNGVLVAAHPPGVAPAARPLQVDAVLGR